MSLNIAYRPHTLRFIREAGTSRGVLTQKTSWIIKLTDAGQPGVTGLGECGPLPGLSIDDLPDFEAHLADVCALFNELDLEVFPFNLNIILDQLIPEHLPSVRFGIEMALLDFMNGGKRIYFDTPFTRGKAGIPMNGLVWMGSFEYMAEQIAQKLQAGYTTIKMKVGAIDFEKECRLLAQVRARFSSDEITLRVDANGAFAVSDAMARLEALAGFDLHSIEQPIRQGQTDCMAELASISPVPIALDEELIGIHDYRQKFALLKKIRPPYIILKPTLLGGFRHTKEWIEIANRLGIGWWITSALESNIGLAAIAQFTAAQNVTFPQGLGTGQLYQNNIPSPLTVKNGFLYNDPAIAWDLRIAETEA